MRAIKSLMLAVCLLAGIASAAQAATAFYPLKAGTGRYLIDQANAPFLILGEGADSLIADLSLADAETYFANRAAKGFNTVWFQALVNDKYGGKANGSTVDGIVPFTRAWDLSTPNPTYFARLDALISLAAKYNIMVLLGPIETGGLLGVLTANGTTKAYNYGAYLGNRYKNFKNILWNTGNDYNDSASNNPYLLAVIKGIKSTDPNHLHTVEYNVLQNSLDDATFSPLISLNGTYTWWATYVPILRGLHQSSTVPVWLSEGQYENGDYRPFNAGGIATPEVIRRQSYWAMLSGATGALYGNSWIVWFPNGWKSHLDDTGSKQLAYWKNLFTTLKWYTLIPDENHSVVTSGYGTFGTKTTLIMSSDYLTAARAADGSLVVAYAPTIRALTVDMRKLSGIVTARWFDPTSGTYTTVAGSPFANTGSRTFTPPGKNSAGSGDWVLVLSSSRTTAIPKCPGCEVLNLLPSTVYQRVYDMWIAGHSLVYCDNVANTKAYYCNLDTNARIYWTSAGTVGIGLNSTRTTLTDIYGKVTRLVSLHVEITESPVLVQ